MKQSPFRKSVNIDRHAFQKASCFLDSSEDAPFPVPGKRASRYLRGYVKIRFPFFLENLFCASEVDICCFCILDLFLGCHLEFSQASHSLGPFDRIIMLGWETFLIPDRTSDKL